MKILKVYSRRKYDPIYEFEQLLDTTEKTIDDCWEEAYEKKEPIFISTLDVYYEALEFGEVDRKFVEFVKDHYEEALGRNFYVVED